MFVFRAEMEHLGTLAQKIVVQKLGNIHQQGEVDAFALQHLVGIGTVAVDGIGKPCHGASLPCEFGSNHIAYVNLCHPCSLFQLTA